MEPEHQEPFLRWIVNSGLPKELYTAFVKLGISTLPQLASLSIPPLKSAVAEAKLSDESRHCFFNALHTLRHGEFKKDVPVMHQSDAEIVDLTVTVSTMQDAFNVAAKPILVLPMAMTLSIDLNERISHANGLKRIIDKISVYSESGAVFAALQKLESETPTFLSFDEIAEKKWKDVFPKDELNSFRLGLVFFTDKYYFRNLHPFPPDHILAFAIGEMDYCFSANLYEMRAYSDLAGFSSEVSLRQSAETILSKSFESQTRNDKLDSFATMKSILYVSSIFVPVFSVVLFCLVLLLERSLAHTYPVVSELMLACVLSSTILMVLSALYHFRAKRIIAAAFVSIEAARQVWKEIIENDELRSILSDSVLGSEKSEMYYHTSSKGVKLQFMEFIWISRSKYTNARQKFDRKRIGFEMLFRPEKFDPDAIRTFIQNIRSNAPGYELTENVQLPRDMPELRRTHKDRLTFDVLNRIFNEMSEMYVSKDEFSGARPRTLFFTKEKEELARHFTIAFVSGSLMVLIGCIFIASIVIYDDDNCMPREFIVWKPGLTFAFFAFLMLFCMLGWPCIRQCSNDMQRIILVLNYITDGLKYIRDHAANPPLAVRERFPSLPSK